MSIENGEKPQIKLPFEGEDFDIGTWVYAHRVGLCVTTIVYLIVAIGFMAVKITLAVNPRIETLSIDLQQLAELERQRDELRRSVEVLQEMSAKEWRDVQNRASNESVNDDTPRPHENNDAETNRLIEEALESQRRMAENRANYESGVAEAQAIKERKSRAESDSSAERKDSNIKGNVTVSYSFTDPVRHAQRLTVPAYQCEGGGEVIISVVINQNGDVTSAKVASGGDDCMQQTALAAAESSRFNVDISAPNRHSGRISYIFVPQ